MPSSHMRNKSWPVNLARPSPGIRLIEGDIRDPAAIDEAGEAIGEAATDTGNAIEDACEDVKEAADAENTDC